MFRYLIIWKDDPNIWFKIQGVSYQDSLKDTLTKDPYYFGATHENYLDGDEIIKRGYKYNQILNEDEEVFHPSPEQLSKCITFHKDIFRNTEQYIVFQINFITGMIKQVEEEDLV